MSADDSKPPKSKAAPEDSGVSRRDFLKISTIAAAVPVVTAPTTVMAAGEQVHVYGPGKVPVELTINGKPSKAMLEPRVTLLDALRDTFDLTGAKRVCDKAECGACTVLLDGRAIYACSMLAIDAQGRQIATIESLTASGNLNPLQQAFVQNDASQCGFCTPGFVMACKALLDQNPHPTDEELHRGLSGNLCRCGTYQGIRSAMREMTQKGA